MDQAAAGLLALGLKKGDRLGMWGPNTYEWILMQFATARAGIILVRHAFFIPLFFSSRQHNERIVSQLNYKQGTGSKF